MPKYRKKPVEIEARRYRNTPNEDNSEQIIQWSGAKFIDVVTNEVDPDDPNRFLRERVLAIPTLEGDMVVTSGDYVIRGVQGEFYPCKPDIFEATYEPVEATR